MAFLFMFEFQMSGVQEVYFGDINSFAIRYVAGHKHIYQGTTWYYAFLHLCLNGQIIGNPKESCSVLTWLQSISMLLTRVKNNELNHNEFLNKKDDELFELIWKANQEKKEFKPEYTYLPQLDSLVWSNCHLSIDETTDAYLITTTQTGNTIRIIWQGWREPCPSGLIDIMFSLTIHKEELIQTLNECYETVMADLINYKDK